VGNFPFVITALTNPMTAAGDLIDGAAAGAPQRLPIGTAGQSLGISAGAPAWLQALQLQATTGATGYTLVNGTGNIITWAVPNDGALHRFLIAINLLVTSAETGGAAGLSALLSPTGASHSPGLLTGGTAAGLTQVNNAYFAQAGSTVTLAQTSALTAGAAVLWAEIWGS
jgi:hypothetical protein